MDVVYRYRRSGLGEELRYSLRSLQNIPHDVVWLSGEHQTWVRNLNVIQVSQHGANKWSNSRRNVVAACLTDEVSDDFIMMDDDFYIMEPIEEIPVLHRGPLEHVMDSYKRRNITSRYVIGLRETAELLRWAGCSDTLYAYNLHIPMVINKHKMIECLDFLKSLKPRTVPQCFHLRSWYGNFWQIGGESARDVKLYNERTKIPSGPFISSSNRNFTQHALFRQIIRKKFATPSPYERGKDGPNLYRCPRGSFGT